MSHQTTEKRPSADSRPAQDLQRWSEMTWTEVEALDRARCLAILPVGAVEAHGPHLPLETDVIIADAMARAGAGLLADRGLLPVLLPPVIYTAAPFARTFPGTLSLRPATAAALIRDVGVGLAGHGFRRLVIANAHLDPTHLSSIYAAITELREETPALSVIFPDVTRKPWALRLSEEFKSGACHAGRYEGSIVMAARPGVVRESVQGQLPANPSSLVTAMKQGLDTFEAAGGEQAYFGSPAEATVAEGQETIRTLGEILAEAVLEARASDGGSSEPLERG